MDVFYEGAVLPQDPQPVTEVALQPEFFIFASMQFAILSCSLPKSVLQAKTMLEVEDSALSW
eukprot:3500269-Amphidinium_carterae.1